MSSRRKSSAKRPDPDDPQTRNIRFDYSATKLDNEDLDIALEIHESNLHREQFRMSVDSEEVYKKAKKDADVMLQLKNAVNKRKPHESFERVSKSAGARLKMSTPMLKEVNGGLKTNASMHKEVINLELRTEKSDASNSDEVDCARDSDTTVTDKPEQEEKPAAKAKNNLTMFLLSLHTLRSAGHKSKNDEHSEGKDTKEEKETIISHKFGTKPSGHLPRRPYTANVPRIPRARSALQADIAQKYGIHVKTDHSRSRRTLSEISKLDQDAKYGHVDKFEERRKRLLASCKDTQKLDNRIQLFLREIDDFKISSSPENSLERILMRSKSAYGVRHTTDAW